MFQIKTDTGKKTPATPEFDQTELDISRGVLSPNFRGQSQDQKLLPDFPNLCDQEQIKAIPEETKEEDDQESKQMPAQIHLRNYSEEINQRQYASVLVPDE